MIKAGDAFALTATDLVGYLNSRHLTVLDRAVAEGARTQAGPWDPLLQILRERGARHESAELASDKCARSDARVPGLL